MDDMIPMIVVAFGLAYASFTDCRSFKVYNRLTFPLFFGGLLYGLIDGGLSGFGSSLGGAFMGLGVLLVPYLMGGLGAGDVKFIMAIGSWIGAVALLPGILFGCVALFVYYIVVIARQQGFGGLAMNLQLMANRMTCFGKNLAIDDQYETVQVSANSPNSKNRGRLIPFSAMMSVGIVIAVVVTKVLLEP